jgi:hypothetical protein
MLQKLENLYLGLLRLVVLLAAGVLLVSVLYYGVQSLQMFKTAPAAVVETPKVPDADLKKITLLTKDNAEDSEEHSGDATTSDKAAADSPKDKALGNAAEAVAAFVKANGEGKEDVGKDDVLEVLRHRAEGFEDRSLDTEYAAAYLASLEKLLQDKEVIAAAKTKGPLKVINAHLNAFNEAFEKDANRIHELSRTRMAEYEVDVQEGREALYISAGAFGGFLSLVFLSVFIRIERNLRHLERVAPVSKT